MKDETMGRVNALWQDEYQKVFDDLMAHKIDADEAVKRLEGLGLECNDARDQVTEVYHEHHQP